jgi:hypothetical protein
LPDETNADHTLIDIFNVTTSQREAPATGTSGAKPHEQLFRRLGSDAFIAGD